MPGKKTRIQRIPVSMDIQKQKEPAVRAKSSFSSPKAREMTDVPPMPKSVPMAMKNRNTGVASDTAATCISSPVCPMKKVSATL